MREISRPDEKLSGFQWGLCSVGLVHHMITISMWLKFNLIYNDILRDRNIEDLLIRTKWKWELIYGEVWHEARTPSVGLRMKCYIKIAHTLHKYIFYSFHWSIYLLMTLIQNTEVIELQVVCKIIKDFLRIHIYINGDSQTIGSTRFNHSHPKLLYKSV